MDKINKLKKYILKECEKISDLKSREIAKNFFNSDLMSWEYGDLLRCGELKKTHFTFLYRELQTPFLNNPKALKRDLINWFINWVVEQHNNFINYLKKSGFEQLEKVAEYLDELNDLTPGTTGAPLIHKDQFKKGLKPDILDEMEDDVFYNCEGGDEDELREYIEDNHHHFSELIYNCDCYDFLNDNNYYDFSDAIANDCETIGDIANYYKREHDADNINDFFNNELEHQHPFYGFKKKC